VNLDHWWVTQERHDQSEELPEDEDEDVAAHHEGPVEDELDDDEDIDVDLQVLPAYDDRED
jgi:hypothetical protein